MLERVTWAWHTVLQKSAQKKINGIPIAVKEGLSSSWEQRTVMSRAKAVLPCEPCQIAGGFCAMGSYGAGRNCSIYPALLSHCNFNLIHVGPRQVICPALFPSLWDPRCVMEWYRCPQGKTCSRPSHGGTALALYGCMTVPNWVTLETAVSSFPFCVPQLLGTLFQGNGCREAFWITSIQISFERRTAPQIPSFFREVKSTPEAALLPTTRAAGGAEGPGGAVRGGAGGGSREPFGTAPALRRRRVPADPGLVAADVWAGPKQRGRAAGPPQRVRPPRPRSVPRPSLPPQSRDGGRSTVSGGGSAAAARGEGGRLPVTAGRVSADNPLPGRPSVLRARSGLSRGPGGPSYPEAGGVRDRLRCRAPRRVPARRTAGARPSRAFGCVAGGVPSFVFGSWGCQREVARLWLFRGSRSQPEVLFFCL